MYSSLEDIESIFLNLRTRRTSGSGSECKALYETDETVNNWKIFNA